MHDVAARAELPTLLLKPVKLLEKAAEGRQPQLMGRHAFTEGQAGISPDGIHVNKQQLG